MSGLPYPAVSFLDPLPYPFRLSFLTMWPCVESVGVHTQELPSSGPTRSHTQFEASHIVPLTVTMVLPDEQAVTEEFVGI